MNILLFGISNVGKSTTGRLLAERLGYRYYDLDEEVKSRCHMTLEKFVHTVWPYERDKIRDEIWFVAKGSGQNSKLYSMVEFKNEKGESVRKDAEYGE